MAICEFCGYDFIPEDGETVCEGCVSDIDDDDDNYDENEDYTNAY